MATRNTVPLWVETEQGRRESTVEEDCLFKATQPRQYIKWIKDNRITLGKALIKSGVASTDAWKEAFERYPDSESEKKPKYVIKFD